MVLLLEGIWNLEMKMKTTPPKGEKTNDDDDDILSLSFIIGHTHTHTLYNPNSCIDFGRDYGVLVS